MPECTVIAVSVARSAEEAEIDVIGAHLDSPAEAMGCARRMADETQTLSGQLQLAFDYSHGSVFEGEVGDEIAPTHPALVGAWLYDEDGVAWSSAAAIRDASTPVNSV